MGTSASSREQTRLNHPLTKFKATVTGKSTGSLLTSNSSKTRKMSDALEPVSEDEPVLAENVLIRSKSAFVEDALLENDSVLAEDVFPEDNPVLAGEGPSEESVIDELQSDEFSEDEPVAEDVSSEDE